MSIVTKRESRIYENYRRNSSKSVSTTLKNNNTILKQVVEIL